MRKKITLDNKGILTLKMGTFIILVVTIIYKNFLRWIYHKQNSTRLKGRKFNKSYNL